MSPDLLLAAILPTGQNDDRNIRCVGIALQGRDELPPVHLRHLYVRDNQGGLNVREKVESFFAIRGRLNRKSALFEEPANRMPDEH